MTAQVIRHPDNWSDFDIYDFNSHIAIIIGFIVHDYYSWEAAFLSLTGLLRCHFVLVIVEVFAAEQEAELWIVLLLIFCHLLEFRSVACHKLSQLVNDVSEFNI